MFSHVFAKDGQPETRNAMFFVQHRSGSAWWKLQGDICDVFMGFELRSRRILLAQQQLLWPPHQRGRGQAGCAPRGEAFPDDTYTGPSAQVATRSMEAASVTGNYRKQLCLKSSVWWKALSNPCCLPRMPQKEAVMKTSDFQ